MQDPDPEEQQEDEDLGVGHSNLMGRDDDENIDELLREFALDAASASGSSRASKRAEEVPVRPPPAPVDFSRRGNGIFLKNRKVGTINYLLRWNPPTFSGSCLCHDDCFITAPVDRVNEGDVVKWLQSGPRYPDSKSHIAFKPRGSYNRRRVTTTE